MYDIFYMHKKPNWVGHKAVKVNSLQEARDKSSTRFCWVLDGHNDYRHFDMLYEPLEHEAHQVHVWPSQHQQNGGTYLIPKHKTPHTKILTYVIAKGEDPTEKLEWLEKEGYKVTAIHEMPNTVQHVKDNTKEPAWIYHSGKLELIDPTNDISLLDFNYYHDVVKRTASPKVLQIDMGTTGFDGSNFVVYTARFIDNYLGTLKRMLRKYKDEEWVWVTNTLCRYSSWDFTWHPSEYQDKMLHVFPSNEQRFGDTFYIHVPSFLEQAHTLELLEWYDTICFQEKKVERVLPPIFLHNYDTQVEAVNNVLFEKIKDPYSFEAPYVLFSTTMNVQDAPTPSLWRKETRPIIPLDRGGERVLVPKEAYAEVVNELYDYPYIDKSYNEQYENKSLDIIFMSNGEECATDNYHELLRSASHRDNRIRWVSDVKGRIASARAAAQESTTDWFFSVNAKLKVDMDFPWDWQPDRLQKQKHYIFYAYNPHTGDTYGHMAMIAWNKHLVMTDTEWGLDFTMSHEHEVIPILSGEAVYGDSPWDAWRTAFREVVKLQKDDSMDSSLRLKSWLSSAHEWTAKGAEDAVSFYTSVNGNMEDLMQSFDWAFLRDYFTSKYPHFVQ